MLGLAGAVDAVHDERDGLRERHGARDRRDLRARMLEGGASATGHAEHSRARRPRTGDRGGVSDARPGPAAVARARAPTAAAAAAAAAAPALASLTLTSSSPAV